jgi:GNAT superfamily N-acetyltransferase
MDVHVRRAEKSDASAIAEMAMKLVEQHVGYDPVRFSPIAMVDGMQRFYGRQTEAANAAVLVAETDTAAVGFAYMQFEPIIYEALAVETVWLHDIYVEHDARQTGAGRRLIEAVIVEAKGFGATKILLSVAAKNSLARGFFEKQGFRTTMHEMMLALDQEGK